ncbi:MAG: hypothetical protein ACK5YU_00710 [Burkholderiales bacterium]|nr:hypothetical protein [Betaproteobacteria bacterium]
MRTFLDYLRLLLVSPELLTLVAMAGLFVWLPEPFELVTSLIVSDIRWAVGAAGMPLGLLAISYTFSTDLLSPQGKRLLLLDWPDYPMLKRRVLFTLGACSLGFLLVVAGLFLVAKHKLSEGTALIAAGISCSAVSLATIALAKWSARELLRE